LAIQIQIRVPPAHLLPIVRRISGVRERGNDVSDNKPPFIFVQGAPDFAALKQCHAGLGIVIGFAHYILFSFMSSVAKSDYFE
jgi:hypothetical protein